jgi:hypothetical protein
MSTPTEKRIEVKSDTLRYLMTDVATGRLRVPRFQREFVWTKSKVIELLDSIYKEYPIGSFFLWKAPREFNSLLRQIDLGQPPIGPHEEIAFILDGQQRITSLYAVLEGRTFNDVHYRRIAFDLEAATFVDHEADNKRYVAVCDIWGPDAIEVSRQIPKTLQPTFDRFYRILHTYPVSIVEVRDKDLPAVATIFQRINQSGKRLDRFDLIVAITFTPDFDLRERFKRDVLDPLVTRQFGAIAPSIVTQLLALLKSGQCTERYEYALTTDDIRQRWQGSVDGILLAADTLRKNFGVATAALLPYDAVLTLLAYYFAKSGARALSPAHLTWVSLWFWRASFALRYGTAAPTTIGQDRQHFDDLLAGKEPKFAPHRDLAPEDFLETRMTQTRSAIRNAFLCLLAARRPVHLLNNSPLDLAGEISDFTSAEKHHIFPKQFLSTLGFAAELHALSNFCFLPAELNKRIGASAPALYVPQFEAENPDFEMAARTHLLPIGADSGIRDNDYLTFLKTRGRLILDEIDRVCGDVTTPRTEERVQAIERIEHRIRDRIHRVLSDRVGPNYWKTSVPEAVRENAEKRIDAMLVKFPDKKSDDLRAPRERLDFLNVMDYVTIVENRGNWGYFEPVFRRKEDVKRYLEGFSEYRNAVVHGRPVTELIRLSGEASMVWLHAILAEDEDTDGVVDR